MRLDTSILAVLATRVFAAIAALLAALRLNIAVLASLPLREFIALLAVGFTLLGLYEYSTGLLGVAYAASIAAGAQLDLSGVALVASLPLFYIPERRVRLASRSARVSVRTRLWPSLVVALGVYTGIALLAYLVYTAGFAAGASIEALAATLRLPEPFGTLWRTLWQSIVFRLAIALLLVYLAYRAVTSILEPLFYALVATRDEVEHMILEWYEAERSQIDAGEAWHQKLYRSVLGHVAGVVSILLVYTSARIVEALAGLNTTWLYASYPLTYYIAYKLGKRSFRGMMEKPVFTRKTLYASIAALLLIAAGYLILGGDIASLTSCAFSGCIPRESPIATLISRMMYEVGGAFDRGASEAAGLIDSILSSIGS